MKGIILAGGSGTRLYPLTLAVSKQILPIYDKPMIYYPLSVLMLSGIKEILIISTHRDIKIFKDLLGDGSHLGIELQYKVQQSPDGVAQALLLGEEFIGSESVCLVLGDNIFHGFGLSEILQRSARLKNGAVVFGYNVNDPERYAVLEFDSKQKTIGLEEKPSSPKSNCAVTGLYYYDNTVVEKAKKLKPSARGELEITDLNKLYLAEGSLKIEQLESQIKWLDTGTHESLSQASNFVASIEKIQGVKVSCLEEIAYTHGFIDIKQLEKLAQPLLKNQYGKYLMKIVNDEKLKKV